MVTELMVEHLGSTIRRRGGENFTVMPYRVGLPGQYLIMGHDTGDIRTSRNNGPSVSHLPAQSRLPRLAANPSVAQDIGVGLDHVPLLIGERFLQFVAADLDIAVLT